MNMRVDVPAALGLMVLWSMVGGCDSEDQSEQSCQIAPTIAFEGREYIAVGPGQGWNTRTVGSVDG